MSTREGSGDPPSRLHRLGLRPLHLTKTDSTNRVAAEAAAKGEPEGFLVRADSQSAGKGRQGRTWFSSPGCGLYFSLLRRPEIASVDATLWTLLAAVALHEAVRSQRPDVWLKWPNDLLAEDRKMAGILCELQTAAGGQVKSIVVGVGLNLFPPASGWPPELQGRANSVWPSAETAGPMAADVLLCDILECFLARESALLRDGPAALLADARQAMAPMLGRRVVVDEGPRRFAARVRGIGDSGALEVVDEDGAVRRLLAGDVHLRPDGTPET
jgi:BirA family biotin operon repressor/biotin-[acetyl-CoA-carboxylase] ligase